MKTASTQPSTCAWPGNNARHPCVKQWFRATWTPLPRAFASRKRRSRPSSGQGDTNKGASMFKRLMHTSTLCQRNTPRTPSMITLEDFDTFNCRWSVCYTSESTLFLGHWLLATFYDNFAGVFTNARCTHTCLRNVAKNTPTECRCRGERKRATQEGYATY